jgi:quinol monooxygenase YgiN
VRPAFASGIPWSGADSGGPSSGRQLARRRNSSPDYEIAPLFDSASSGTADAVGFIIMVRFTLTLVASQASAGSLLDALRSLIGPTRLEPGCLGCVVWEEVEGDTTLRYAEEWATEGHLRRHVQSDRFTSVLAVMEAATEPPHVQFDFVTITRGLDYVAEVRLGAEA